MLPRWRARGIVAASAFLAVLLAWMMARPPERIGDVPYVATRPPVIDRMLELAEVGPQDLVVDLGSGDGRIVLRAAGKYGARGRGIEIDPELVRASRAAAVAAGVADRVEFVEGDLFAAELAPATAVTMFLLPTVNLRLRPRLLAELAPGTPVVSHMWDMGEWSPDRHAVVALEPPADVYQWIVPAALGGEWDLTSPAGADTGSLPSGAALRLLQRFQQLDGELVVAGRAVGVAGRLDGDALIVETTRPHPSVGKVTISGTVVDDRIRGLWEGAGGPPVPVAGARRAARIDGVWEVGGADGSFAPRWSMRWVRDDDGWAVRRWRHAAAPSAADGSLPGVVPDADPSLTGSFGVGDGSSPRSAADAGPALRAGAVDEIYVWGGSIAFMVPAADGSARRVSYYGLVSGDRLDGVAHDGSRRIRWTARRTDTGH